MINYTEKGLGLHEEIKKQGYRLWHEDGVTYSDNDTEVQIICDNYDPLPHSKKVARQRIKLEAAKRSAAIYPFIDPESEEAIGLYNFASDLYTSILPAARGTLSQGLADFKAIYDAANAAISDVNALTDWTQALNYDAVNTPIWP